MGVREVRASGLDCLALATELLHRVRLADEDAGLWEAADVQWWWRTPRRSDSIGQLFWVDEQGPVAGAILTDWGRAWHCDPILVPTDAAIPLAAVWTRAREAIDALGLDTVETLVRDDDAELQSLAAASGFVATRGQSGNTWMDAEERAKVAALPDGFTLVDRSDETAGPHPMRARSGEEVEVRLRQCSLYDPRLDLSVRSPDDHVAGYALFWLDPVTRVGLVEPVRVEEAFQRRGLARALLTEGLDRLAGRGARRMKVGYATEAARALYVGAGFKVGATDSAYVRKRPSVAERSS
jgi:ribosomal protein S18 acetylase RimI-like enzyme